MSLTGVSINHDGRAATITAPNGTAQQRVLRSALAERQTNGEDVTMIECHGTGAVAWRGLGKNRKLMTWEMKTSCYVYIYIFVVLNYSNV